MRNKRGKRILALVLMLVMLMSLAPVSALAAEGIEPQETPTETPEPTATPEPAAAPTDGSTEADPPLTQSDPTEEPQAADAEEPQADGDPEPQDGDPASDGEGDPTNDGEGGESSDPTSTTGTADEVTFTAQLISGAAWKSIGEDGSGYVWTANNSDAGHRFTYRVSYNMQINDAPLPEGAIEISVPRHILQDRGGASADSTEFSIPSKGEVDEDISELDDTVYFAYKDDPNDTNKLILYNFREIDGSQHFIGYIELAYSTTKSTFNYVDMAPSVPFQATATINGTAYPTTQIPVYIDTHAKIVSTDKRYPTLFQSWQDSWYGKDADGKVIRPTDAGDYWYLTWEVATVIDPTTTQYYTLDLADTIGDCTLEGYNGDPVNQEIVGYRFSGKSTFSPNSSVENQTQIRTRYDTVLTRVKKDPFADVDKWTVNNSVTVTVTPKDGDSASSVSAKRSFSYQQPEFTTTDGSFRARKRADGAWRRYVKNGQSIFYGTGGYGVFNALTLRTGDYSRYDLNDFWSEGALSTYGGFDYAAWVTGTPNVLTLRADGDPGNPEDYFQTPVIYEMIDERLTLTNEAGASRVLTAGDYQIDSLQFNTVLYDAYLNANTQTFQSKAVTYTEDDVLYIYGRFSDGGEWQLMATRDYYNDILSVEDGKATVVSNTEIKPANGCIAYRLVMKNAHYYTSIGAVPSYTLLHSEAVDTLVDKQNSIILYNHNVGNLYTATDTGADWSDEKVSGEGYKLLWVTTEDDQDYARVSERDSGLNKKVVATANDTKRARFTISWRIDMTETVTSGETGVTENKTQDGGTFYDLLPKGATVDLATVAVRSADGGFLPSASFTVTQKPLYYDGRTLLIVTVKDPGENYSLYYSTVHTWESINDFGRDVYNPVAYETGNEDIANGKRDNGSGLKDSSGMVGLDQTTYDADTPENTPRRFIYADQVFDITALYSASSGLTKRVRSLDQAVYTAETFTSPSGIYVYRLRYAANTGYSAKDMVFVDNLEQASSADDPPATSQWRGTLLAVDISQLKAATYKDGDEVTHTLAPVVYYNTEPVSIDGYNGGNAEAFLSEKGWIKQSDYTGPLSEVKAIAIDCRKATDGTDFVLEENKSISAFVYMTAPSEAPEGVFDGYPETYNGLDFLFTNTPKGGEAVYNSANVGVTTVKYRVTADLDLHKVSTKDESINVQGVTFHLFGTSDYGNEVDLYATTDRSGELTFSQVEMGRYTLQEYEAPADWQLDVTPHTVVIDRRGQITVDGAVYTAPLTLKNDPRAHADIAFMKYSKEVGTHASVPIEGVVFLLSGESRYGNPVTVTATSDKEGRVSFSNIEEGDYTLSEYAPSKDYQALTAQLHVAVDDNSNVTFYELKDGERLAVDVSDWLENDAVLGTKVLNMPKYWDFEFIKVEKGHEDKTLQGATFELTGTSDNGTPVSQMTEPTSVSNVAGQVSYTHLEPGTYTLKEKSAPHDVNANGKIDANPDNNKYSYITDTQAYTVVISNEGDVTILQGDTELTKNAKGEILFPNTLAKDDQIIITKIWDDDLTNAQREAAGIDAIIHLVSSESYSAEGYIVTYHSNGGYFATGSNLNKVRYVNGEKVGTEREPIRYGYDFGGWYTDTTYATPFDPEEYSGPEDITVYAKWNIPVYDFDYTGDYQVWTAPITGTYQFEAWGANGGRSWYRIGIVDGSDRVGVGAYTSGEIYLEAGQTIYIYVGGQGAANSSARQIVAGGWNGGGDGYPDNNGDDASGAGGGATDFRLVSGTWNNFNSLKSRIMVAAGGGGAQVSNNSPVYMDGFDGGETDQSVMIKTWNYIYYEGSLSATGQYSYISGNQSHFQFGGFGYGANGHTHTHSGAGAGGGWYGGLTGCVGNYGGRGGGGISYISGYDGCYAIDQSSTERNIIHKSTSEYTGYVFANSIMSAGAVEKANPDSTGNGHARITFLDNNAVSSGDSGNGDNGGENSGSEGGSDSNSGSGEGGSNDVNLVSNNPPEQEDKVEVEKVSNTVWTYTFPVANADATYTAWEETIANYFSNAMDPDTVTINGLTDNIRSATITNSVPRGGLEIHKYVRELDTQQKFVFTVTLTDKENQPLTGTRVFNTVVISSAQEETNGSLSFTNGVAKVALAHNEGLRITGLPIDYHYNVTEAETENFVSSWAAAGVSGVIAANETAVVTCYNIYDPPQVPDPRDVTLQKVETGNFENHGSYPVQAIFSKLLPNAVYSYTKTVGDDVETLTFTASDSGSAILNDLTLTYNTTYRFLALPVGATYSFTEAAGDYTASYVLANSGTGGTVTSAGGGGLAANQALSTAVETVDEDEDVTVTFTNVLNRTGSLTVAKTVAGYDAGLVYKFHLRITELGSAVIDNDIFGRLVPDEGVVELDLELRNGDSISFDGIPVGARYQVTEKATAGYRAAYKLVDAGEVSIFENVEGSDGYNKSLATEIETVNEGEDVTVTFTNTVDLAPLTLTKTVTGNMGSKTKKFDFTVEAYFLGKGLNGDFKATLNGSEITIKFTDGKAENQVKLAHGDTLVIQGLPVSTVYAKIEDTVLYTASYTVTETNGLYTASYTVNGGNSVPGSKLENATLSTNTAVAFTNDLEVTIPTGVGLGFGAGAALILLPLAALTLLTRKRGKHEP